MIHKIELTEPFFKPQTIEFSEFNLFFGEQLCGKTSLLRNIIIDNIHHCWICVWNQNQGIIIKELPIDLYKATNRFDLTNEFGSNHYFNFTDAAAVHRNSTAKTKSLVEELQEIIKIKTGFETNNLLLIGNTNPTKVLELIKDLPVLIINYYILLMLLSTKEPKVIIIDDFLDSVSPKLTRSLGEFFISIIENSKHQVIATTHNNNLLDAVNIFENKKQSLFRIHKYNHLNHTRISKLTMNKEKQIYNEEELIQKEMRLSSMWNAGLF